MDKAKKTHKPKSYWEILIQEVTQNQQEQPEIKPQPKIQESVTTYEINYDRRSFKYELGEPLSSVYFTQREAECVIQVLRGKTMNETGDILRLSPRTIEYYLGKIKRKLNCRKKKEIIQLVSQTDFVKNFSKDPYNLKEKDQ